MKDPLATIYSLPLSRIALVLTEDWWMSAAKSLADARGLGSWRTKINCSARSRSTRDMVSVTLMARSVPEGHPMPGWGNVDQTLDAVIEAQRPASPNHQQAVDLTDELEMYVLEWKTRSMLRLAAEAEQLGLFVYPKDRFVKIGEGEAAAFMEDGALVSVIRMTCTYPDDPTEGELFP